MTITAGDFYILQTGPWAGPDTRTEDVLDRERLAALITARDPHHSDLDVSLALMDLVRDDLLLSGTGGGEGLSDADMRLAIRALERTSARVGHGFKLPFRDHSEWRAWWNRNDGYGSWQARRDLLSGLFDEAYARLMAA